MSWTFYFWMVYWPSHSSWQKVWTSLQYSCQRKEVWVKAAYICIYFKFIKSFLFIISNFIPLHVSDYKGWTALHHAAFGGYTRTMQIILDTNVKCTDRVDEEGVCVNIICFLSAVASRWNVRARLLEFFHCALHV